MSPGLVACPDTVPSRHGLAPLTLGDRRPGTPSLLPMARNTPRGSRWSQTHQVRGQAAVTESRSCLRCGEGFPSGHTARGEGTALTGSPLTQQGHEPSWEMGRGPVFGPRPAVPRTRWRGFRPKPPCRAASPPPLTLSLWFCSGHLEAVLAGTHTVTGHRPSAAPVMSSELFNQVGTGGVTARCE